MLFCIWKTAQSKIPVEEPSSLLQYTITIMVEYNKKDNEFLSCVFKENIVILIRISSRTGDYFD